MCATYKTKALTDVGAFRLTGANDDFVRHSD